LSVIAGGESLMSHAGGVLLVETARRSGLAGQLSRLLGPWRRPMAVHDPGKIVTDLAIAVALGGDAAADIAVLRAAWGVRPGRLRPDGVLGDHDPGRRRRSGDGRDRWSGTYAAPWPR
jgi:Transposase DDE domain group 1